MSSCELIVCEKSNRWAAALQVTCTRQADLPFRSMRVYEVRSFKELLERLERQPQAIGLICVNDANLPSVLNSLAAVRPAYPQARFVALLDMAVGRQDVADAMIEAGACEIVDSPRRLQQIMPLVLRHAQAVTGCQKASATTVNNSLVESVWDSLPWQADAREVV